MKDEALRLALEALRHFEKAGLATLKTIDAITAIKQALAQTEPEPAIYPDEAYELGLERIAYYTSPPKREPLTDEEIDQITKQLDETAIGWSTHEFARAIEAAHGIKGEA